MNRCLLFCFLITLFPFCQSLHGQRLDRSINQGWRFHKADAKGAIAVDFDDSAWLSVDIPHTWNHVDEPLNAPGDKRYYRGAGWYRRSLEFPETPQGTRTFLRFEAALTVADVYLNGTQLGQHRGGFTAFTYEITDAMKAGNNLLALRVDNSFFPDVPPLSIDFTYFGGIYRPVHVIQTGPLCISPLVHGSSGVRVRQSEVSPEQATVSVMTYISNKDADSKSYVVKTSILDVLGRVVADIESDQEGISDLVSQSVTIKQPHLWNGIEDPYLYTIMVVLMTDGKVVDIISQPLGLRFFNFDKDRGFTLNGKPYRLRGVCRHQSFGDKGSAVSEADMELDMELIREMGANAVRLAHYPHADYFLQLCDRYGIIAWSEIPLVNDIRKSEAFTQNATQQLEEMIAQLGNHPSIVMWGLWNELQGGDPAFPLVQKLNDLAHQLDPTRPTTAASFFKSQEWCPEATKLTNLLAINTYSGWYYGSPDDMNGALDDFHAYAPDQPLGVSEYGAGASILHHQQGMTEAPKPRGDWHPEEWQATLHEAHWNAIEKRPFIWGSFVWVMFDFASAGRSEGDTIGVNNKGLVTRDRKVKKDAFYFYKASWSPDAVVYITSRRHLIRTEEKTPLKVYSNADTLKLTLNGKALPAGQKDGVVYTWKDIALKEGENTLVATAEHDGQTIADQVTWTYAPATAPGRK